MAQVLGPALPQAPVGNTVKVNSTVTEIEVNKALDLKAQQIEDTITEATLNGDLLDLNATHLISSPYLDFENQLQLGHLDLPNRLFAFALTALKPIRDNYATAPYLESFNWSEVFTLLRSLCSKAGFQWQQQDFYVVIFRSKLRENIDRDRLGLLDQKSHQEACASGGLLKYWFGSPDEGRRNLATCLWRNHDDAVAGGSGPWHKQARGAARVMYDSISFHTHKLVIEDGAESWRLETYS